MKTQVRRFGTLDGVFLPTILSIFGVILFLRTGWVVGNAGLLNAIFILTIAEAISFCTGLSIATISTNIEVGTGGVYYIISRSLGVDTGGTIGIPLYFSQAISIAFYIIGFLEATKFVKGNIHFQLWGTILLLCFSSLAFIGADLAVKFQYIIALLLFLGIASFLTVPPWLPLKANLHPHYVPGYNFWKVFAIFFPAVTGITAGIGLSGELKDPGKNIPQGIIWAVLFGFIVYIAVMWKAASLARFDVLIKNIHLFIQAARFPLLVIIGIWAATLSSALTFALAAPRTLKALAEDKIIPRFFAATLGSKKEEPRMGVIVTFFIAEVFILAGSLNKVASVITMFFLITYGVLNLAAALEGIVANPSYRPRFKVPWYVSFSGFLGILLTMVLISPMSATVAFLAVASMYLWLKRKNLNQTWGDVRTGVWISLTRFALLQLEKHRLDSTNWRPNLMVFTGNPETRFHLAQFAHWLSRGNGIVTLFNLIPGEAETAVKERQRSLEELKNFIKTHKLPLFAEVEVVRNLVEGIPYIVQAHGIGNLHSNVALFGWGHESNKENLLMKIIRKLVLLDRDVLILKYDKKRRFGQFKRIDIWWGGKGGNIMLMLLLAHILRLNDEWKGARVRVFKIINSPQKQKIAQENIEGLLYKARLEAEVKVLVVPEVKKTVTRSIDTDVGRFRLGYFGSTYS